MKEVIRNTDFILCACILLGTRLLFCNASILSVFLCNGLGAEKAKERHMFTCLG
jgi:hypothetical protein